MVTVMASTQLMEKSTATLLCPAQSEASHTQNAQRRPGATAMEPTLHFLGKVVSVAPAPRERMMKEKSSSALTRKHREGGAPPGTRGPAHPPNHLLL